MQCKRTLSDMYASNGYEAMLTVCQPAQDLLQYKDRDRWYLPTFAADDAPDWNTGRFVRSRQLAPGVKEVWTSPILAGDIMNNLYVFLRLASHALLDETSGMIGFLKQYGMASQSFHRHVLCSYPCLSTSCDSQSIERHGQGEASKLKTSLCCLGRLC